jgi:hypothetical protein
MPSAPGGLAHSTWSVKFVKLSPEGSPDRAEWLGELERTLWSGDAERRQTAIKELHSVVHGMGGLLDIDLASAEERRRVADLIDQPWAATKPQSKRPHLPPTVSTLVPMCANIG